MSISLKFFGLVLGLLAILFALSVFRSATLYAGLTLSREGYYKMTREPNSMEKFWGDRALESWNDRWANQKELAVELVQGKTLIGMSKERVLRKMSTAGWFIPGNFWIIPLPLRWLESDCALHIIFDDKNNVSDTFIESS